MSDFRFLAWPTEYRVITQHFGTNAQYYAQFGLPGHEGIDMRAPSGSKIFAVAPGVVSDTYTKPTGHNYGKHVRVNHQDGYQTIYAHLQEVLVAKGEPVEAGALLGLADNTGNSFGSHLHLTLKQEGAQYRNWPRNIVDPTPFLLPLLGWEEPSGPYAAGWIYAQSLYKHGTLAQAALDDVWLRSSENRRALVPGGTIVLITGEDVRGFTPVKVPVASLGVSDMQLPTVLAPLPPPNVSTLDGWAWQKFLNVTDAFGVVNTAYGINLRMDPDEDAANIGVLRRGSTVQIIGEEENGYLPVRVRQADFVGKIAHPNMVSARDLSGQAALPDDLFLGWVHSIFLTQQDDHAMTTQRTLPLRSEPEATAVTIATIKGSALVTIAGKNSGSFTPILVNKADLLALPDTTVSVTPPEPLADQPLSQPLNLLQNTMPGWALKSDLVIAGDFGNVKPHGTVLWDGPRKNARRLGTLPADTAVLITSSPYGEYVPVRVGIDMVTPPAIATNGTQPNTAVPPTLNQARIGLHASADPAISPQEHQEFAAMRPGLIKILTFHDPRDITRLAQAHPNASWIVRVFLSMENRTLSPQQFFDHTQSDLARTLGVLSGKDVVIELHNEPNLTAEGMTTSWQDGKAFNDWWLALLACFRQAFPNQRYIYPGLSPGNQVSGIKEDHIRFIEASREAVAQADGLGVHLYWSRYYPMQRSLAVLDDYLSRFRNKPIWVTEASNNKGGVSPAQKAGEYLTFWRQLQQRPLVQGVTFFVASASNPAFAEEVWVGRGIGQIIGQR